jgi:hypothetical protein
MIAPGPGLDLAVGASGRPHLPAAFEKEGSSRPPTYPVAPNTSTGLVPCSISVSPLPIEAPCRRDPPGADARSLSNYLIPSAAQRMDFMCL